MGSMLAYIAAPWILWDWSTTMGNPPLTYETWWMDQRKIHGVEIVELLGESPN